MSESLEIKRARQRDAMRRYRERIRTQFGPPPPRGGNGLPDGVRFAQAIRDCTVDPITGCWLWPHSLIPTGYGQFHWAGSVDRAHRISAYVFLGLDPESELQALHICDTPPCVNPAHLYLGTIQDNMRDRVERARVRRGEECSQAKLDEDKVRDIRSRAASGASTRQLADYYGVTPRNIRQIIQGQTWRHVA